MVLKFKTQNDAEMEVQRLQNALASVESTSSEASSMVSDLTQRLQSAQQEIEAKDKELARLSELLKTAETEASSISERVERLASDRALQIVASQGTQPLTIKVDAGAPDFTEAYRSETDPRKRAAMLEKNLPLARKLAFGRAK